MVHVDDIYSLTYFQRHAKQHIERACSKPDGLRS
jgi:hypothetical protein